MVRIYGVWERSGEGGIRTPGTRRYAAFRVQCIQPDSATSPFVKVFLKRVRNRTLPVRHSSQERRRATSPFVKLLIPLGDQAREYISLCLSGNDGSLHTPTFACGSLGKSYPKYPGIYLQECRQ